VLSRGTTGKSSNLQFGQFREALKNQILAIAKNLVSPISKVRTVIQPAELTAGWLGNSCMTASKTMPANPVLRGAKKQKDQTDS
jgi:hypothetical protein